MKQLLQTPIGVMALGAGLGWGFPALVGATNGEPTRAPNSAPPTHPDPQDWAKLKVSAKEKQGELVVDARVENPTSARVRAAMSFEVVDLEGNEWVPETTELIAAPLDASRGRADLSFIVPGGLPDGRYDARIVLATTDEAASDFPFAASAHVFLAVEKGKYEVMSANDWHAENEADTNNNEQASSESPDPVSSGTNQPTNGNQTTEDEE